MSTILIHPRESAYVRQRTSFALAELGTAGAAERLESIRRETQRARWWSSPDASIWLERTSQPAGEIGDSFAWQRRDHAVLARWGDRRLLVFSDPAAGGWGDLWISEIQPDGSTGEPAFLGAALGHLSTMTGVTVYGRIEGGRFYSSSFPDGRTTTFDLTEAWGDQDDDGLTDPLERRLGTDATRADTDEDGIPDPEDLVPQASADVALDDEEEIALAVLDSFFRYGDPWSRDGVAFVKADRPLPWTGRNGPTFTVAPERVKELGRQLGSWQSPIFGVHQAGPDEVDKESLEYLDLEDGDRLYIVTAPQEAHFAIVRRVGDRWVVREIRMWWIA